MINWYSATVLVFAAVSCYMGCYYIVMHLMHREQSEDLPFALSCLFIAANDLCNAGLYNASNLEEGMAWERWNFVFIPLISVSLIWFVLRYTKSRPARFLYPLGILIIASMPLAFVTGEWTITTAGAAPKIIHLGSVLTVTYYQAKIGPVLSVQMMISLAILFYGSYLILRQFQHNRTEFLPILVGLIFFFIAAINDYAVTVDAYEFIYLTEFSFLVVIVCMNYSLLRRFVNMHRSIQLINATLEEKVAQRTSELNGVLQELETTNDFLQEARDHLWGEMELAKKIQTVLLPRTPAMAGYEIGAIMLPADEVGGDYYDIINADGFDWVVIGDVSGHGISAGLIMMMVQTAVQTVVRDRPSISPTELLEIVNRSIGNNIALLTDDKYVTITALSFAHDGGIRFSGLHQDLIVYRKARAAVEQIPTDGLWLSQWDFKRNNSDSTLALESGDVLLLYSDGIPEASHGEKGYFGCQKLADILLAAEKRPAAISKAILEALAPYTCRDDVTLVIIQKI